MNKFYEYTMMLALVLWVAGAGVWFGIEQYWMGVFNLIGAGWTIYRLNTHLKRTRNE